MKWDSVGANGGLAKHDDSLPIQRLWH